MNFSELSKTISHALRHKPWLYELELDEQGWVEIEKLLMSLRNESDNWKEVNMDVIRELIKVSEKKRFEIDGGKIRALYGHSIPQKLSQIPSNPPDVLYHGTTKEIAKIIQNEGLKPMNRQYVHLSVDIGMAKEVARRKGKEIQILTIDAGKAKDDGIKFYIGNDKVWLCDIIAPKYIKIYF